MNTLIQDGKIQLFSFVDNEKCERVFTHAVLPANMAQDWNGSTVNLIDWKIADDGKTVRVEYQTRQDAYAPILDAVLACEQTRVALCPPNRSKNWEWSPYFSYWRNRKTGERVSVG